MPVQDLDRSCFLILNLSLRNIKANNIVIDKHDNKKGTVKSVGLAQLKGKRFLEYIAYHDDNLGEPILQLTMAFEKGYSIEIAGSAIIQQLKSK